MPITRLSRALLLPMTLSAALALGACGADQEKVQEIRERGAQLQERGKDMEAIARKAAADVKAGRITQAEADRQLEARTKAIVDDANDTASDAIDVVKDQAGVPDEAKRALEDAQENLGTAP